jgi:hypothetical protein
MIKYEKGRWLKATFAGVTKRLLDPPRDKELLVARIIDRFPILGLIMENEFRP